ncbi:hypothetical protein Nepgr_027300 [Nepenthes gracilis]|uniref:Uncharacterized protein n=1 Tax=Nepenthes gracilis TaxID=150966 RepID=A0AAD3TBI3_NEPGR|nr:hypothetical protein Nepgr_027300 [Nepenthes gracilis]
MSEAEAEPQPYPPFPVFEHRIPISISPKTLLNPSLFADQHLSSNRLASQQSTLHALGNGQVLDSGAL